jgi:glutathione S-transferase
MVDLYTRDYTAGTVVRCLLEEVGEPYRLIAVERGPDGSVSPAEYTGLNPNGTVPTLVDGDLVLYETAAILLHLADSHPESGLASAPGSSGRPLLYRWLLYVTNNVMAAFYRWFKAEEMVADPAAVDSLKRGAIRDLERCGRFLDAELAGRPYLLGDEYTIADLFLAGLYAWADEIPGLKLGGDHVAAHRERVEARPAFRKVYADEGMLRV